MSIPQVPSAANNASDQGVKEPPPLPLIHLAVQLESFKARKEPWQAQIDLDSVALTSGNSV